METLYGVDADKNLYQIKTPKEEANQLKALVGSQTLLGTTLQFKRTGKTSSDKDYRTDNTANPIWKELASLINKAKIVKITHLTKGTNDDFRRLPIDKLDKALL